MNLENRMKITSRFVTVSLPAQSVSPGDTVVLVFRLLSSDVLLFFPDLCVQLYSSHSLNYILEVARSVQGVVSLSLCVKPYI